MITEPRRRKLGKGKRACSLSAGLRGNPSMFDGKKLSLVGMDIHFIDELNPKITEAVKTIYLSNNYLANLANLDQFVNVEAASIMNNSIRYLDELQSLSRLKKLKALSLQGNVVTRMPFYREHVVNLCPALTLLDDEKVSPEYRRQCQLKATTISEYFNYLRLNELRNGVLVHICKMMECHAEIRLKFGKDSCYSHGLQLHIKEVEQLGSGAGAVLQVLLQGGVFCWLQRMDCRHFNRLVQDNLYKLLVEFMRQNKGPVLQGAELSELWQALGKVYRDDQFDFYSQIIAFCALLRQKHDRKGSFIGSKEEEMDQSRDRDCADHCLSRLQFLATPCPLHCQLPHTAARWRPSMEQQLLWRQEQYHETAQHRQQQQQLRQDLAGKADDSFSPPPSPPRYPPFLPSAAPYPCAVAVENSSTASSRYSSSSSNSSSNTLKKSQPPPIVQRLNRPPPGDMTPFPGRQAESSSVRAPQSITHGHDAARHAVHFTDPVVHVEAAQRDPQAAYTRLLQESQQQRELEQLLQDGGVLHRSRSDSIEELMGQAERRLQEESRNEHVSERYEQLLQQHQHHSQHRQHPHQRHTAGGQDAVSGAASSSRKPAFSAMKLSEEAGATAERELQSPNRNDSMSMHLPPQLEEPVSAAPRILSSSAPASKRGYSNNNNGDTVVFSVDRSATGFRPTAQHLCAGGTVQVPVFASEALNDIPGNAAESQVQKGHDYDQDYDSTVRSQRCESLEFSSEVVAFIQRNLQHHKQRNEEEKLDVEIGKDTALLDVEDGQSDAACKELEARWLLAAEAIKSHITTSSQAQDLQKLRSSVQAERIRTAALKAELAELTGGGSSSSSSMEALRGHINKTFDRLNLMERSNLIAHAQYRALLASLNTFREQALAVSDSAVLHLSVQAEEVTAVRKDAQFGLVCLRVHEKSMGRIEELQERIAKDRELAQKGLAEEDSLGQLLRVAAEGRAKLQAALTEVSNSLASVREEGRSDPAVLALKTSDRYTQLVASFYPSSLACTSLKKHVFRTLRVRTTRQRRIKLFHLSLLQRRNRALKKMIVTAWATVVRITRRGQRLQRWKEKDVMRQVFCAWIARYRQQARIVPLIEKKIAKRRLRHAFSVLTIAMRQRREEHEKDEKHALYVTLFRSIRVFRAWKAMAQRSAETTRQCLAQARQRSLQRLFDAWQDVASQSREQTICKAGLVMRRTEARSLSKALCAWLSLLQYRSYLGLYRRKKRAMSLLLRRVRSLQGQKRLQKMAGVVAASPQGLMGSKLLVAWKRWHLRTARAKYFRHAEKAVRQRDRAVTQYRAWCTWRTAWQHRRAISRKLAALARRSADNMLQHVFELWKAATMLRKARVPHLREQWLHLFDEPRSVSQKNHHLPPPPLQAAAQTSNIVQPMQHVKVGGNKLRQSLNNLEFQLLYWDDDDEHECEGGKEGDWEGDKESNEDYVVKEPERADHYRVLVRRYLIRWWSRAARRASLLSRFDRVQGLVDRHVSRRCFAAVLALYGRSLMTRRNECRQFLVLQQMALTEKVDNPTDNDQISADPASTTRRAELESLEQSAHRERENLRQLADSLTLELTAWEQELGQGRAAVQDVVSSIAALRAEQGGLQDRVRQTRDYVQAVTARRDSYLEEAKQRAKQANHLPSLLARLADGAAATVAENVNATGEEDRSQCVVPAEVCSADERLLLMQDVEALYRKAVTTQEALLRKRQHLENQHQAAETLLQQRQCLAQELDGQIAALGEERGQVEEALRACQASLEGAFAQVAEQTREHEALLTSLQREEEGLRDRLAALSQQERALADKVDALHAQRERRGLRSAAADAAHRLGRSEALMAEHLSLLKGSAIAAAKATSAAMTQTLLVQKQQQQSERSYDDCTATTTAAAAALHNDNKSRMVRSAAAEERRKALLLASMHAGTGKENNYVGSDALPSPATAASAAKGATVSNQNGRTIVKKGGRVASHASVSSKQTVSSTTTAATDASKMHRNGINASDPPRQTASQEDIDRQIEALSLRIRQRLTNI